ncbi:2-amino-4-hydroxy-6-hydroxymethyldihydropteridine diphosphokinase, partial [Acinetobacter baumannii]
EAMGRTPTYRWGPRLIDLDLLTCGKETVSEAELILPHPLMHQRGFVLVPLAEIDSSFIQMRDDLPASEREAVQLW